MRVQLARWGNSTGVRIPKAMTDELGLIAGASVELIVDGHELRIRPPRKSSRALLDEMVAEAKRLGPEFEPETIDWGPDRGSETVHDDDPR